MSEYKRKSIARIDAMTETFKNKSRNGIYMA